MVFLAYADADDESSKNALLEIATKYHGEFLFGLVTDAAVIEAEKVAVPAIKCIKPLDNKTHEHQEFAGDPLEKFVLDASRPIIAELLPHNHQRFLDVRPPLMAFPPFSGLPTAVEA